MTLLYKAECAGLAAASPFCQAVAQSAPTYSHDGLRDDPEARHGVSNHQRHHRILTAQGAEAGVPLEMYFSPRADRLYVTSAKPGHLQIFDTSAGASKPRLLKSIATAEGAHHVAFTKDWRYAYVQNALLNLPGMSDGSITVVDLKTDKMIGSVDTLKNKGLNPNSIVLLPEWNHPAGH